MKYAPANAEGLKPYTVEVWDWAKIRTVIVYSDTAANAKYAACGRATNYRYVRSCHRSTPQDLADFHLRT